jgi:Na+/phosphate symporter
MYPLVLGANMGTAIQTVIGAMDKTGTAFASGSGTCSFM